MPNAPGVKQGDWSRPAAMAIPNGGAFKQEQGRYGQIYPRTPANYGFSVMAKVKPGREVAVREYGSTIEKLVAGDPKVLAPLKLHYLRWVLFEIKGDTYFTYQGIFDTDFDAAGIAGINRCARQKEIMRGALTRLKANDSAWNCRKDTIPRGF